MKKIAKGYYIGTYNGIEFTVTKVEEVDSFAKSQWYWQIGDSPAEDWYSSKKIAILAAKDWIDELVK